MKICSSDRYYLPHNALNVTIKGLKRFFVRAHEHAANVGGEGDTGKDILLALEKFDRHASLSSSLGSSPLPPLVISKALLTSY